MGTCAQGGTCGREVATCEPDMATCDPDVRTCAPDSATRGPDMGTCGREVGPHAPDMGTCEPDMGTCGREMGTYARNANSGVGGFRYRQLPAGTVTMNDRNGHHGLREWSSWPMLGWPTEPPPLAIANAPGCPLGLPLPATANWAVMSSRLKRYSAEADVPVLPSRAARLGCSPPWPTERACRGESRTTGEVEWPLPTQRECQSPAHTPLPPDRPPREKRLSRQEQSTPDPVAVARTESSAPGCGRPPHRSQHRGPLAKPRPTDSHPAGPARPKSARVLRRRQRKRAARCRPPRRTWPLRPPPRRPRTCERFEEHTAPKRALAARSQSAVESVGRPGAGPAGPAVWGSPRRVAPAPPPARQRPPGPSPCAP